MLLNKVQRGTALKQLPTAHFFSGIFSQPSTAVQVKDALTPEAMFFAQNRVEVRCLYRDLLKQISVKMDRKLQREAKFAEFRFMFKQMAKERDIEQINEMKMTLYTILDRLEADIYPPFPDEYNWHAMHIVPDVYMSNGPPNS